VAAAAALAVPCLASDQLGPAQTCRPVSCGLPPVRAGTDVAGGGTSETTFGQKVQYVCAVDHGIDEKADGEKAFGVSCEADGQFAKVLTCRAISCGEFPSTDHARYIIRSYSYRESVSVVGDTGYTVDGEPGGSDDFASRCGSDGEFQGVTGHKPVTRRVPKATDSTTADSETMLFGQVAVWTCKEGFSTDGSSGGPRMLSQICHASGLVGRSSPDDCQVTGFCADGLCGANGACTDMGAGVLFPSYNSPVSTASRFGAAMKALRSAMRTTAPANTAAPAGLVRTSRRSAARRVPMPANARAISSWRARRARRASALCVGPCQRCIIKRCRPAGISPTLDLGKAALFRSMQANTIRF